ncbi:MAG: substrate-binding domain-containing protein [Spirochaetales bacterium]|nr:substrate-binding domain-containing protein [Spirochaetales bacterium]
MKKGAAVIVLFFLLSGGILHSLGFREEEHGSELQFAILIKKGDESWYRKEAEGFAARCRELGVSSIVMDNKMDPNIALVNIDLAIEKKVDGIAIVVPEQRMGPLIVDRAFESNIAIVSLDLKLLDHQGRQLAPHFGLDDKSAGYSAGVWLARQVQELEWYGSLSNTIGIAAFTNMHITEYRVRVNECQRALFEWLPELSRSRFFKLDYPGTDAVGGLLSMQELLNQHPEITNWIVFSATDEGAIGAVRALEQVGLGSRSIACGIQAERAFGEFSLAQETAFKGAVFYDPYQLGSRAADALYSYIKNGSAIPAVTSVPFKMITRNDFRGTAE